MSSQAASLPVAEALRVADVDADLGLTSSEAAARPHELAANLGEISLGLDARFV